MPKKEKKRKSNSNKNTNINTKKNIIIIAIIITIILMLATGGIGLYFYLDNKSNKKTLQEETQIYEPKLISLPDIFINNTVPICNEKSCLAFGKRISLNQLLTSTSGINNIIIKNILNQEEMTAKQNIYGEDPIVTSEEARVFSNNYLLLYNTFANVYRYIIINGNSLLLDSSGFKSNNRIIKFVGFKYVVNNTTYYCDLTYYSTKNYVLICDDSSKPLGIISKNDFDYLNNNNRVQRYVLNNIQTIIVTNYSILVLDNANKLIGILSIL
jgi:hypothetical protein